MHSENIFRIFSETGSRSSVGYSARADRQTKVPARASNYPLERTKKYWIGEIHARRPLERVTQSPARAYIPPLERTDEQCKVLGARISRSSAIFPARAEDQNLEIPNLSSKLKTQVFKHQIRSSWAHFLENL